MRMWVGFIWLRTATSAELMWSRQWTFGFHIRRWISWPDEWLSASQQGLPHGVTEYEP
jgi:hypothetical protein